MGLAETALQQGEETGRRTRVIRAITVRMLAIVSAAVVAGLLTNALRATPLEWRWSFELTDFPSLRAHADAPRVELAQARQLWSESSTIFLDARGEAEFQESHIPGAVNLPADSFSQRFPDVAPLLEDAPSVVLYCTSRDCDLADQLASELRKSGMARFSIFDGGMEEWTEAGLAVETGGGR
jgi:rhodanese-related sulfurtransferase